MFLSVSRGMTAWRCQLNYYFFPKFYCSLCLKQHERRVGFPVRCKGCTSAEEIPVLLGGGWCATSSHLTVWWCSGLVSQPLAVSMILLPPDSKVNNSRIFSCFFSLVLENSINYLLFSLSCQKLPCRPSSPPTGLCNVRYLVLNYV